MNHLSRMYDYIVIDSGAALSAAPRTFAAPWSLETWTSVDSSICHRTHSIVPWSSTDRGSHIRCDEKTESSRCLPGQKLQLCQGAWCTKTILQRPPAAEVAEHEPTQLPFKYGARTVHSSAFETKRTEDRTIPVTQRVRTIPLVLAARAAVDRDGFVVSSQQDA